MQIQDTPAFRLRVWANINASGRECWPWMASCKPTGYGQTWDGKHVTYAHRAVYVFAFGPIPDGMFVCHHCDNPICCRPSHLFLGTHADNMQDMLSKGRGIKDEQHARGDRNGRRLYPERYGNVTPAPHPGMTNHAAKLTDDDVREIQRLIAAGDLLQREIATMFGVSQTKVSQIKLGKAWKHLA